MTNRQIIGNGRDVQIKNFANPASHDPSFFGGGYPGLGQDFQQGGLPVPFEGAGNAASGGASSLSSMLSGINVTQIKGFVDRMGGIEGIIGTMTKVQKVMANLRQMAPMLKLLFNSFGKVKSTRTVHNNLPLRRRKRRKKSGSAPRKSGKNSYVGHSRR
jgi:hypothetical protein